MEAEAGSTSHVVHAAEIIGAYVSNDALPVADLPALIASVHVALAGLGIEASADAPETIEKPAPAQIRKSITPDTLISFLDGKPYKTLKRHLNANGLDVHAYHQRYGLPSDYPVTAPSYAAKRSELARSLGLGQLRRTTAPKADESNAGTPAKPTSRGRPRKVPEADVAD